MLEELYREYYRELYAYIYSLCGQAAVTEDILQETFLKALIALKDSHTNMRAWLYMVARNLCFDYFRSEKRKDGRTEAEAAGGARDVLEDILRREEQRRLWEGLHMLSVQKREILVLQYFAGLRQKEIAAILHLTPENVRILAYRAKKELREFMKDYREVDENDVP